MFCTKCGKENADDAIYCQKCGREFAHDEDETRVAARRNQIPATAGTRDISTSIFTITPTLKFVYVGYALAVLGAFLLVALVSVFFPTTFSVVTSVILGMALLLVPVYYHLRKKLVRYTPDRHNDRDRSRLDFAHNAEHTASKDPGCDCLGDDDTANARFRRRHN
jgi:hypothetical protein